MRVVILCILVLTGSLILPLGADIPIAGMKQYDYQYVINNTGDYPDYLFLTSSEIWNFEYPSLVVNGTFSGGYKLDGFVLHAIRQADLDPAVKGELTTPENVKKNLSAYFESAPLVTSELILPVATSINDTVPLTNLSVLLQVTGINARNLNITKVKTIYQYQNGTIREEYDQAPSTQDNLSVKNDISQEFSVSNLLDKI